MRIAISVPTEAEYNELMQHLESKGYFWKTGFDPTGVDNYSEYKDQTVIIITEEEIQFCRHQYAKTEGYQIFPHSELKANNFKIEIEI